METKHQPILSAPVGQSGGKTLNNPICRSWLALALGGFLFTSIFALPASPVEAQCSQWNVGHGWQLKQGPTIVHMSLHQNGTVVTGTAKFWDPKSKTVGFYDIDDSRDVSGDVVGTVKGDHFAVHIHWDNNTNGFYNGTIRPSGKIEGTGYNQVTPSIKVNWYSETTMVCADAAPAAAAPIKSSASVLKGAGFAKPKPAPLPVKTYDANDPNRPRGFITGLQSTTPTPTPSAEADESSSNDTDDQHGKHKKNKNKKKHHHHDDDENQGND